MDGAGHLSTMTWDTVPADALVLVPVGSTEQHGPHLPLATDAIIAERIAREAAPLIAERTGARVVVAPTLPYGASGEHQDFPGTVSIGHDALRQVLVELVRSISNWAGRVVLVNGHGGNSRTVVEVVRQLAGEQHRVSYVNCSIESAIDAHAGHYETSLLLHLRPDIVSTGRAEVGAVEPLERLLPTLVAVGVRPVSPNGVLGDPTRASADDGRAAFSAMVRQLVREVCDV